MIEPGPAHPDKILVFTINENNYALPVQKVIRVIHIVESKGLPEAPDIISGLINVQGEIIPVIDVRKRLGLESREPRCEDKMVIADTGKRKVALHVDAVSDIIELNTGEIVESFESFNYAGHLLGMAKVTDDIILIYNLEKFLSLEEEKALEMAMKAKSG